MPFFLIFHGKMAAFMPIKNFTSLKHTLFPCPLFVKKRQFSQKHGSLMSFFSNISWKTPAVMPMLGQQNVNSVNTTKYYGPKKSIGRPFFSKTSTIKNTVLSRHLFKFFHEKPLLSCPYLVKITSILSKLQYFMDQQSQ